MTPLLKLVRWWFASWQFNQFQGNILLSAKKHSGLRGFCRISWSTNWLSTDFTIDYLTWNWHLKLPETQKVEVYIKICSLLLPSRSEIPRCLRHSSERETVKPMDLSDVQQQMSSGLNFGIMNALRTGNPILDVLVCMLIPVILSVFMGSGQSELGTKIIDFSQVVTLGANTCIRFFLQQITVRTKNLMFFANFAKVSHSSNIIWGNPPCFLLMATGGSLQV